MTECPRANKRLFRCKWEGRYDTRFPPNLESMKGGGASHIEALKERIYVRDICVRCGRTIERKNDNG